MEKLIAIVLIVITFVVFNVWIVYTSKTTDKAIQCEINGGLMADTTDGYKCVKVEEIKL